MIITAVLGFALRSVSGRSSGQNGHVGLTLQVMSQGGMFEYNRFHSTHVVRLLGESAQTASLNDSNPQRFAPPQLTQFQEADRRQQWT